MRIQSSGSATEQEAREGIDFFRFCVHLDGAANFQSPFEMRKQSKSAAMDQYATLFNKHKEVFLSLPCRGSLKLNAAQRSEMEVLSKGRYIQTHVSQVVFGRRAWRRYVLSKVGNNDEEDQIDSS